MSDQVVLLSSKCHHGDLLESMHQLRLQGHLCDITVQVDFHGELEEFEVHQVVLAASSGYFKGILLNQDSLNKLFLTNMRTTDFAIFLEYVYTGKLKVAKDKIGDIHEVAILLDCKELTEICSLALNAGGSSVHGKETSQDMEAGLDSVKNAPTNRVRKLKAFISPTRSKRWEGIPKRVKVKATAEEETGVKSEVLSRRLSNRLAGRKVFVDIPKKKYMRKMKDQSKEESLENTSHQDIPDDTRGDETLPELLSAYTEMDVTLNSSDAEDQDDIPEDDPEDADDPLFQLTEGEEDGDDGRASNTTSKRGHTQYKCEKCQRTFLYEKSYLKHISMSHGVQEEITYKCDTCQQTFANRGNLKIHQKHVHSDERLFPCDVCTKTFKRKKDVIRHQRQVHEGGGQRHICTICSKPLSSRTALTLHERIHTGDKPYKCTDCDAKFSQSSALTTHRRTHTGEKPFACDQCDARFTQNHMLSYHKRCHTGEKPFMCESCGKSFASKEYLKHHSRIHTGSKPYKCEQCGRAFAQRNSLHQHLKIHTGERPYCCTNCDKQFTQLNALQRHQRIHTGEKPYMCGLCNRTFTDKSTVRRHTMTHDKDTPWKNYLVVLKDNMEGAKKPKSSPKVKQQKTGAGEQSGGGGKPQVIVPAEHITLHGDWGGPGTIALVSHTSLEGFTVIQTEVPAGTQLQPIVTTDSTGASVITLDGSTVSVPFSIPVSMAHSIPVSSSSSLTGPVTLSVPVTVSGAILTPVLDNSTVSTASVLETAVSQTILAPVSVAGPALETAIMDPDVEAVAESTCVSEEECVTAQASEMETDEEQTPTIPTHGHHNTAENTAVVEAMEVSTEDGAV